MVNAGPGPNDFVPANALVDAEGLHLKIAPTQPGICSSWSCGEVWLNEPLGYGYYSTQVTMPLTLEVNAVLGIFLWDDDEGEGGGLAGHREIDVSLHTLPSPSPSLQLPSPPHLPPPHFLASHPPPLP